MKTLKVKPGSILLWKEYSGFKKWLNRLFHIRTPYNEVYLFVKDTTIYFPITKGKTFFDYEIIILEPKVDLTNEEISKMQSVTYFERNSWFDHVKILTNIVRPNTIESSSKINDLRFNENYKVVYDFSKKD